MHHDEVDIDEGIVRGLLRAQFPDLAHRPLRIVEPWGTDNAIWRLGGDLVLRFPRIGWATGQVRFEDQWLPRLAPHLPVALPQPVAVGEPSPDYPFEWAVHEWLPGGPAGPTSIVDANRFARDLAGVIRALSQVPTENAPAAKNRARPLAEYDEATRGLIHEARHLIDAGAALAVWEEALDAPVHDGPNVWVHGDLEGNCLVSDGRLSGLIDWGLGCVGDPAVDLQVVWSPLFTAESRRVLFDELEADPAAIARSRGATINQACGALPYYLDTYPLIVERSWHKLAALGVGSTNCQAL